MKAFEQLQREFTALGLEDWKVCGNVGGGGQAQTVEVRNLKTGDIGVFRVLTRHEPKDLERFYRDVKILSTYHHPNVIRLLASTTDERPWYITEKGGRFTTYWNSIREKYADEPERLLVAARDVISGLTDGLIGLHERGVVHRDIKAANVVVIDEIPKLIDFGIAFVTGEERLTPVDGAAANKYSPDPALNFMEDVPPWLDVYLLAQLLIWMLSVRAAKSNIDRPLDWRFVLYPKFSEDGLLKIRAITAACSDVSTAPRDAKSLRQLFAALFDTKRVDNGLADKDRIERITQAISKGKASQIVRITDARSSISARLPLFQAMCRSFEAEFRNLFEELRKILPVEVTKFDSVQGFLEKFQDAAQDALPPVLQTIPIQVSYGDGDSFAAFGVSYLLYTAKQLENQPQFKSIENLPVIAFTVNGSNDKLSQKGKVRSYYVVPTEKGTVRLLSDQLELVHETSIHHVVSTIKAAITDPEMWEILYE